MAISMFNSQGSPIAIDFGASSVKLMQLSSNTERPQIVGAAELPIPDSVRGKLDAELDFLEQQLPEIINRAKLKGKRAVISIPNSRTLVQHMQLARVEGANDSDIIKTHLQTQFGCAPDALVVRHHEVCDVHRGGQSQREVIVVAMVHETIMRYVNLLARKCKIQVAGVHSDAHATAHAFEHLTRRGSDEDNCSMYINLGWSGTLVTITRGPDIIFSRHIAVGGRQFDMQIAKTLHCDINAARTHRLEVGDQAVRVDAAAMSPGNAIMNVAANSSAGSNGAALMDDRRDEDATAPGMGQNVGSGTDNPQLESFQLGELLDTLCDELSMCIRYHRGLFPENPLARAIFVGGEARQLWLCRHLVNEIRLSAQLGDPLTRFQPAKGVVTPGLDLSQPQPGWAVPCGLCTAPTDF